MSHFDDMIDREGLSSGDEARLRRVHDLLVQAMGEARAVAFGQGRIAEVVHQHRRVKMLPGGSQRLDDAGSNHR